MQLSRLFLRFLRATINSRRRRCLAELLGSLEQSRIKEANLRAAGRNLSISRGAYDETGLGFCLSVNRSKIINSTRNSYTHSISSFIFTMIDSLNSHSRAESISVLWRVSRVGVVFETKVPHRTPREGTTITYRITLRSRGTFSGIVRQSGGTVTCVARFNY